MPTATEKSFVIARIDELEPAARIAPQAPDGGRQRFDIRRHLDITAFGVSAFSAPNGEVVINEHDETLLGEAGQQELYVALKGSRLSTRLADVVRCRFQRLARAAEQNCAGAQGGQLASYRRADAAPRAGYDRNLTLQRFVICIHFRAVLSCLVFRESIQER